jgi:hypothetical protein
LLSLLNILDEKLYKNPSKRNESWKLLMQEIYIILMGVLAGLKNLTSNMGKLCIQEHHM